MTMLLECLQKVKKDIENKGWNQISTEEYKKKYEEISIYVKNWKDDKYINLATKVENELSVLSFVPDGSIFTGNYFDKLDEEKQKAFDKLKDLLRDIEI